MNLLNTKFLEKKKLYNFRLDFGIGLGKLSFILVKLGVSLNKNVKVFYKFNYDKFIITRYKRIIFYKKWLVAKKLKYYLYQFTVFLQKVKNYKFLRFKFGLPLNGQRTHSNRKNSICGLVRFKSNLRENLYQNSNSLGVFSNRKKLILKKKKSVKILKKKKLK